jgi:hypothetical protein
MREFSQREFWIFVMTIMHTSQRAQSLSKEQRVAIEEAIRAKHCPDIPYQEWEEIELNIVKNRDKIQEAFISMLSMALGKKIPSGIDSDLVKTLDDHFRHIVDHVNIAELREVIQQSHTPQSPEILDLINEIEKLQKVKRR